MPYLVGSEVPDQPAGLRFQTLLDAPGILQLPGAHNGQAALQAKAAGFDALYLSGAAMTASMGLPDLGIITVDEVAFFIRQITRATGLPLLVDGDTGYGEALNVMHMVRTLTGDYKLPIELHGTFDIGSCLNCHATSPAFRDVKEHQDPDVQKALLSHEMSCTGVCHPEAHPASALTGGMAAK